jgi:DNA-binding Xre family transcriptional regulator
MNKPLREHFEHETDMGPALATFAYIDHLERYIEFLEKRFTQNYVKVDEMRALREKKGITLRQVEQETGISNAYLSQLETGKITNPSFRVVEILNNFYTYGISKTEIF